MELRHLRYFVAVVRCGSFSAAADQLGRTQQAVSKAIAQLEERLGVRLLDRDARTPRPTAFGELLLERAEEIDAALGRFEVELAGLRSEPGGPVRWGASPAAASRLVSSAVLDVMRERPGIRCTVKTGIDRELLPALSRGDLDVVVAIRTRDPLQAGVIAEVLGQETYAIVCGRSHPLASRANVTAADLVGHRWLYGHGVGDIEQALAGAFDEHGLPHPVPAVESDSVSFGRAALASGEFLGVLPLSLAMDGFAAGQLRRLRVAGFEWQRPMMLYRRRAAQLSTATLVCLDALHRAAARIAAGGAHDASAADGEVARGGGGEPSRLGDPRG